MELPQIDPMHPGEILHDFITDYESSITFPPSVTMMAGTLLLQNSRET